MDGFNGAMTIQDSANEYIKSKMMDYDASADDAKEKIEDFRDEMQKLFDELPESQKFGAESWLRNLQAMNFSTGDEMLKSVETLRKSAETVRNVASDEYEKTKESLGTGMDDLNNLIDSAFTINIQK